MLDQSVENFLRSKGVITLDFGAAAYVDSEAMPAILLELVEKSRNDLPQNADLLVKLEAEVLRYKVERQKIIDDNAHLVSQASSHSLELAALKEQVANAARMIETLKTENAHLQVALKNVPAPQQPVQTDEKLKQSYEKIQKEFQVLRAQSVEAITSLKVLEDENEELRQELDQLKAKTKNAAVPKTG